MMNQLIEKIISPYKSIIGKDYLAYKNHVHRISILTLKLKRKVEKDDIGKIAIAAVHHDIGIWTAKTFDYLEPSIKTAKKYLTENNLEKWTDEISLIIDMHHKRSVYKGKYSDNVESFRRADFIDITRGKKDFGVYSEVLKKNYENYPMLGFRSLIFKKFLKILFLHPFNPLPMMKK